MPILLPNGQASPNTDEAPKTQAVVMETDDGKKVAYPLVACAVISPEVLTAIGEACVQAFLRASAPQTEEPPKLEAAG